MTAPQITYRFHLPEKIEEITLEFEQNSFRLSSKPSGPPPAWAALDFEKCSHCPLSSEQTPLCPFAHALSGFVGSFSKLESYIELEIEVITASRRVSATKSLQTGIASLVGLVGATSGCPHLDFYRPMARHHMPFAEEHETLYRVLSTFLLQALFDETPPDLPRLAEVMADVGHVNQAMAKRIRAGFDKDAMVNALVILDCFVLTVPLAIDTEFQNLRRLFTS